MKYFMRSVLVIAIVSASHPIAKAADRPVLVSPLGNCIRQFYDPQTYNWLSFENDCGVDISITFIFGTEFGGNEMDLRAGRHDSTGRSAQEVQQMGGFKYVICPMGFTPNDYAGHPINRNNKFGPFRCRKV